jgi:MerR family transcriptional regulator, heat shock protein HspR
MNIGMAYVFINTAKLDYFEGAHKVMQNTREPAKEYYTIGETADLLGVSVPTIRLYEREGLILAFRNRAGHRMFSDADIERIRCLRAAINDQKISIQGIRHLLALLPCWRIKDCPEDARTSCAAFSEHDTPCWLVTGKSWECRNTDCRQCPVYVDYSDCRSVKNVVAQFTVPSVLHDH